MHKGGQGSVRLGEPGSGRLTSVKIGPRLMMKAGRKLTIVAECDLYNSTPNVKTIQTG